MTVGERIDNAKDKIKGKTNEVVGGATGNESQKLKGHGQQVKGDLKDVGTDIKESFRDD
ncbi:MAG TPA: CsbD family protein [Candidatus Thermoplasmatota archaeon]|nr:CsbD family protein [Candidatus Thermoplasmatota archaeon]